jgi:hypothetical protein
MNLACRSDAGVPRVPRFCTSDPRAQTLAKLSEVIGEREAGDVLDVFVAELARNAQANRSAERHRKLTSVHTEGNESLRVQCVGHVDAVPPVGLDRTVDNVSNVGESAREVKDVREGHAAPFGDI